MNDLERLKLFCKRFDVRPRHLQRAFEEEAYIMPRTVRAFMSGAAPFPTLDNDTYMRVLTQAAGYRRLELIQALPSEKEMRSDNTWKRNRAKRLKQAEILGKRERELPIFGPWPTLKTPLSIKEKGQFSLFWRQRFLSLPIERAYVLGTDFDVLAMLIEPDLSAFCELITQFDLGQKAQANELIFDVTPIIQVKDILKLMNCAKIQQWRRYAQYDYRKVFTARLSSEKKKYREQTEDQIVKRLRIEAWGKFYDGLKRLDFWRYDTPQLLMERTGVLDDRKAVKLILGFLCCQPCSADILDRLRNLA